MSAESNFSYTTKVGNDLYTVRGDDYDTFLANLIASANVPAVRALLDLLDGNTATEPSMATATAALSALGATPVTDPFAGTFPPVAPPSGASAGDRTCVHGVMIKRTGQGAKGEWRAWFCPTPKGTEGQCAPQFANKKSPAEWNAF